MAGVPINLLSPRGQSKGSGTIWEQDSPPTVLIAVSGLGFQRGPGFLCRYRPAPFMLVNLEVESRFNGLTKS